MQQPTNNNGGAAAPAADFTQQQQQQQWLALQQYQQQQWLAMQQYPAAAAAMHHQMMYQQPQYMAAAAPPYGHYQQPQQPPQQMQQYQQNLPPQGHQHNHQQYNSQMQGSGEENKTIWCGDLQPWMDEAYLQNCFAQTGEVLSIKLIRNKQTGQSERYGFIELVSHAAAEKVLQTYNGSTMPNTDQPFRLNWAGFSTGERRADTGSDLSVFVGDLAADVTDTLLHETFASRYPSVKGAKVVVDTNTGCSKGYGFVRFGDENERSRALTEMNGAYCSSRPMRINIATPKKPAVQQQYTQQQYSSQAVVLAGGGASFGATQGPQSDGDQSNTTIFVGGLDSDVTDEELRQSFSQCGEVLSVKIPLGKGCGFVQFASRINAEEAIQNLNGITIGKQAVRLSWGRSPANRQRGDSNGGYYGKQQGYGGYGYGASQNQDPGTYGAAYGANGYGNHQQPVN